MIPLEILDDASKEKILTEWKGMSDSDKAHFINQVALVLSVWGSDEKGKASVIEVLRAMTTNGSDTLADFGLYIEKILGSSAARGIEDKIRRAAFIVDGYRIKNGLPSEPHKNLDF
ncbi:hypothetical protein HY988_02635 [Candidatus Micrarchaeota archaeon]|nr:hypothetical protein [Candidatus Micrarchaeota archaeon]